MKRKTLVWLFVFSVVGFSIGYLLPTTYDCGNSIFCYKLYTRVAHPLFYGMGALAIVFLILAFLPTAANAWKKFAIWFVPLAAFLFIFYPEPGSGDFFSPYPEQIFQWVSCLYVIISILIIIISKLRRPNPPLVIK